MKRIILIILITSFFIYPALADAAEIRVSVTIPSFPVTIDGRALNYRNDSYPLILYKNITYFPMTYDHCAYLGVATAWTERDGLYVAAFGGSGAAMPNYGIANNSAKSYTARVAAFPIHVNGKMIDNNLEEYPLLLFRGITYFPMTWRFATEELSWEIEWNNGLNIRQISPRSYGVISVGSEGAYLNSSKDIYGETLNPDGSITYTSHHRNLYYARLNFSDDSITPLNSEPPAPDLNGEDADIRLQGNFLYYEGKQIADISDIVAVDAQSEYGAVSGYPMTVYGEKTRSSGGFYLTVGVSYKRLIQPPYTPHQYYHFIAFDGSSLKQLDLGDNERLQGVYAVSDGVYISTVRYERYVYERNTLWFISKDAGIVNVNDKFNDFDDVRIIGTVGDTAYIKCLWKQLPWWISEKCIKCVSLINDGYYKLERNYAITKIYPYITTIGDMLSPTGNLYAFPSWRNGILNLTKGSYIDLSNLPVSLVETLE